MDKKNEKQVIKSWAFFRGALLRAALTFGLTAFLYVGMRWSLAWAFTVGYFLESFAQGAWDIFLRPRWEAAKTGTSNAR